MAERYNSEGKRVPTRHIPIPDYLSSQAQACLAAPIIDDLPYPPLDDAPGWHRHIAAMEALIMQALAGGSKALPAQVNQRDAGGVPVFDIVPTTADPQARGVILEVHGGALILGGGEACRITASDFAERMGHRVWAVDYRMPPDHPYPAPLDDCLTAYRALLAEVPAHEIVISGMSAGGNLAAALILRARDEGLPLPGGAILLTPEVDLTESGDSVNTNAGVDTVPASLMPVNLLYAAGHDLAHPYLSPLFGDFSKGFPRTILTAGTRDIFLSNTVRLHRILRQAGVQADLHVIDACGHVQFPQSPEVAEIDREIRDFIARVLGEPPQLSPSAPRVHGSAMAAGAG